jgi:hypothetical protein
MKRAKPCQVGPNGPGGGRSGLKERTTFYDRLKGLTPQQQTLLLMYGKDGPGTPAQQLAAQIRTLDNLVARHPQLESSAAILSMRNGIDQKMARLSSQERARLKAGQIKGGPTLPKWSDKTMTALLMLQQAKAGPLDLIRLQRDLDKYPIAEPLPFVPAPGNKVGYTVRYLSWDLRTLRKIARSMGLPSWDLAGRQSRPLSRGVLNWSFFPRAEKLKCPGALQIGPKTF